MNNNEQFNLYEHADKDQVIQKLALQNADKDVRIAQLESALMNLLQAVEQDNEDKQDAKQALFLCYKGGDFMCM